MAQTAGSNKFEKWELPETMATLVTKQNANLEKIDTRIDNVSKAASFEIGGVSLNEGFTLDSTLIQKLGNIVFINATINGNFVSGPAVPIGTLATFLRPKMTWRAPLLIYPMVTTSIGRAYVSATGELFVHLASGSAAQVTFVLIYKVD